MASSLWLLVSLPLVLFLVSDSQALLREFVPGKLRQFNDPLIYNALPCEAGRLTVCKSCSEIKVCLSSSDDTINPSQKCPSTKQYCSMASGIGASCEKTPDTARDCAKEIVATNFYCTGVGYYPDPYYCQKYYDCEAVGAEPNEYECPEGYRYNSQLNYCQLSATACITPNCTANSKNVFTVFPTDNSYYAYCQYDYTNPDKPVLTKTYVMSCGSGATFNPTSEKCEFKCTKEGSFVNTANPRQYYRCYNLGGKLTYTVQLCKYNQKFDNAKNKCLLDPSVPVTESPSNVPDPNQPDDMERL